MFHATLLMISTCFMHTLCHIYAFSGTNLLTRCRRASCCFLLFLVSEILVRKYSRNWTKSTPRGLFFHEASRRPRGKGSGATRRRHSRAARPRSWPRGQGPGRTALWCRHLVAPLRLSLGLLEASWQNRPLGVDFVQFREYFLTRISETKNSRKQQLALRHLVNRLVPENA